MLDSTKNDSQLHRMRQAMRQAMPHAMRMYLRLISVQLRSQLQYRTSFLMDLAATTLIVILEFSAMALVFERFGHIRGWRLGEVAFLYGLVEFSFGLMELFFSAFDARDFGNVIRRGTFDQLLLRPMSITMQVLGSRVVLRRLGKMASGFAIFLFALSLVEIQWTALKIAYLPFVIMGMVFFFSGLFILGATVTFWTIDSIEVLNILTYGGRQMIAYPMHIYHEWMRRFFTYIVPVIFLNYYPALYILDKADPLGAPLFARFLAPIVGIGVFCLAIAVWRFGIRHYQSTGT